MCGISYEEMRDINKELLEKDESHLWPICGKFNVTKRAIRRVRSYMKRGMDFHTPVYYRQGIEDEISNIVNDERNW